MHADFAAPIIGVTYLVLVDTPSKWPEVITMAWTSVLDKIFAIHGLPCFTLNTRRFILFFFINGIIAALTCYGERRIKLKSGMKKSSTLIYEVVQKHTNHVILGLSFYLII